MVKKYLAKQPTAKKTSQMHAIPGREKDMTKNNAGGYAFKAYSFDRVERFLILGTEGGTYYVGEHDLTKENVDNVRATLVNDHKRVVDTIVDISLSGRAAKNDPAIYALALACSTGNNYERAYALSQIPKVCRIGTHLFSFCAYVDTMRGWGPALRKAVAEWYESKPEDKLAYQLVKYQQRDGWSHRDVLRLAHPAGLNTALFRWAVGKPLTPINVKSTKNGRDSVYPAVSGMPFIIQAYEDLKDTKDKKSAIEYIGKYGLTHEMLPTELLKDKDVWAALLEKMPLTAMIRSLGRMSNIGLVAPLSDASKLVVQRLSDTDFLHKSRVHPITVLAAELTYKKGQGVRGKLTWTPVPQVVDALDDAFYAAFDNVEPTGKSFYLGVDVSSSMGDGDYFGIPSMKPSMGAAAMALLIAKTEPNYFIGGFSTRFIELKVTAKDTLGSALTKVSNQTFGGTDTSVAINHAYSSGFPVDCFVILSDGETWAGDTHTSQAMLKYRHSKKLDSKLAVINMVANKTRISDPQDLFSLDIVGFDASVPTLLRNFVGAKEASNPNE